MCGCRTSYILETECLTETCDNTIFPIVAVDIGKYDIVFLVPGDEIIEFSGYIVDITGVLCLSDETRESFTASEADRAFCRDTASEESYTHELSYFNVIIGKKR